MVPEFGIEQQRLGRNAPHMQAGAAEKPIFFNECGFQTVLPRTNSCGVAGRAASDNYDVVNDFCQKSLLQLRTDAEWKLTILDQLHGSTKRQGTKSPATD